MPKRAANEDEFAKYERAQEEILWLQDFVFNTVKVPFPTILLVGKRFSGKSYTSVSIAAKFDIPRWAAWCGTKDTEDFWAERFESSATVKGPDEAGKAYLTNVIRYQQRKGRLYKKVLKRPFPRKFTIGLIFDDVTASRQFRKGEILEDLFSNGRHYHAVIIISAQYLKQLPPAVRLNTDYMFMMHNTKRTIKVLYEDYVEEPDEFGMFLDLIRSVTGQIDAQGNDMFNALVYDNVRKTQKLEEVFKIYRNEGENYLDNVKLGDASWREFNKNHYKDEDFEIELREHRKQERVMRLKQYRDQQMMRRANPALYNFNNPLGQVDLDFYDDDDSDDENAVDNHDTVTLQHRGGSALKINFSKKATPVPAPKTSALPQAANSGTTPYTTPQQQQQQPNSWTYPQMAMPSQTTPSFNPWQQQQQQVPGYNPWQAQSPHTSSYNSWQTSPQQQQQQQNPGYTPWSQNQQTPSYGTWPTTQPTQPSYNPWAQQTSQQQSVPTYNPWMPKSTSMYNSPWQQQQQQQQPTFGYQPPAWSTQQDFIRTNSVYTPAASAASPAGSRFYL